MTETKPQEPKPVPAQDAAEQQSPQEVDEAQDKFQTVGAKNHRVENIKKNYSKPVSIPFSFQINDQCLEYQKTLELDYEQITLMWH